MMAAIALREVAPEWEAASSAHVGNRFLRESTVAMAR
jgi:hypothetical protein